MGHKANGGGDYVEKVQQNISSSFGNVGIEEEVASVSARPNPKKNLQRKNNRRSEALDGMQVENQAGAKDYRES